MTKVVLEAGKETIVLMRNVYLLASESIAIMISINMSSYWDVKFHKLIKVNIVVGSSYKA